MNNNYDKSDYRFIHEVNLAGTRKRIANLAKKQTTDKLVVAFCGVFTSGKSSLINLILNQKFKLPTGIEPITKFVTRLEYGRELKAWYIRDQQDYPLTRYPIDISKVEKVIKGDIKLPDDCSQVIIRMPAEVLKNDIVILDTPGYQDNAELEQITREAILSADVAIFCCNAAASGKKFELDYFQELEDSIGNFCVVVNYLDAIHSQEDFEKLQNYMDHCVAGRGKFILGSTIEKNIFYTIAAGQYLNLNGFDKFFIDICQRMPKDMRNNLKSYATIQKNIYNLNKIAAEVMSNVEYFKEIYSYEEDKFKEAHREKLDAYYTECNTLFNVIEQARKDGYERLDEVIATMENKMDSLEKEESWFFFQEKANASLRISLQVVPTYYKNWQSKNFPSIDISKMSFFTEYSNVLNEYSVPAPKGIRIKRRGAGKRVLFTILSLVIFDPEIDDGYDTEYHGYANDAKKHIKDKLVDILQRKIDDYLKKLTDLAKPKEPKLPVGGNEVMKKISLYLNEWNILRSEIKRYLNLEQRVKLKLMNSIISTKL